jgi:hypothetical protein
MKSFRISLRNVAIVFACLAAVTVFSGCDKEDEPDPSGDDASYYNPLDGKYEKALRNVRINYSWQYPFWNYDKTVQHGQILACKDRLYIKEDDPEWDDPKEDIETIIITESPYDFIKAYSLVKNEWYEVGLPGEYPGDVITPGEGAGSKGMNGHDSDITGGNTLYAFNGTEGGLLYKDRTAECWGKEVIKEGTQSGYHIVEGLRIDVQENAATIAGRKCTKYACYSMSYIEISGQFMAGSHTNFVLWYSVWFDPETDIIMRFEVWDAEVNMEHIAQATDIKYRFEINEIEFNKVQKADIDAILNNYLSTHTPKDVSGDEEPGAGW